MASNRSERVRNRYGICLNDSCSKCKTKEVQEIPARRDFLCAECGKPLRECPPPRSWWEKHGKKVIIGVVVALLAGGGATVALMSGGDTTTPPPPVPPTPKTVVETPVATPNGGKHINNVTVMLECATEGASMHYTLDGTDPTSASTQYSSPLDLTKSCTLKVIACKNDSTFTDSKIFSANYIVTSPVATPIATPNGGEFKNKVSVQVECATEGAVIYYTTDGTDPTLESEKYTDPINITKSCTLKVLACKDDSTFTNSEILSADYTITYPGRRYQGTLNLGYGKYSGEIVNGKPDGAGVLVYSQSHKVVSTKDVIAKPGERIEGVFENGKASFVTLYKKDGNVIKVHR